MTGGAAQPVRLSVPVTATAVPSWTRSAGFTAGTTVAVVLAASGLVFARIDLALLALPLVAALAWSRERRPAQTEAASATLVLTESGGAEMDFNLTIEAPAGV